MKYWGRTVTQNWTELQNKPTILLDNQVTWTELQNKPANLTFVAENQPGNWQPWLLSSYYGNYLEWMPLTTSPNPWTMVQRGGNGNITATSFKGTNIPASPDNLSAGSFYRDSSGFIKVVF